MSTAIARPATPFPHVHQISHNHSPSSYHHAHYFSPQPIHFHLSAMASPVPPSLLKRDSSERVHHIRTPSSPSSSSTITTHLITPNPTRRPSVNSTISSASTSSPVMPSTPLSLSTSAMESPSYLSLPPSIISPSQSPLTEYLPEMKPRLVAPPPTPISSPTPVRPQLKRRDTPRPRTITLASLDMSRRRAGSESESEYESKYSPRTGKKTLTSVIDGGAWVVLEDY